MDRPSFTEQRRNSQLPMQWRLRHSSRWMAQVLASEFSLLAFLVLLVMVFSKKWLYPSESHFYQHFPKNITDKIHTAIHTMSTGLLYVCISKSCTEDEEGEFLPYVNGSQPVLTSAVAPTVLFSLSLFHQPSSCGLQDGFLLAW